MVVNITKFNKGIRFSLKVIPKSSKNEVSVMEDGTVRIKINAPPVDGKANQACIKYFSDFFEVPRGSIRIIAGEKSRVKVVEVCGQSDALERALLKILNNA